MLLLLLLLLTGLLFCNSKSCTIDFVCAFVIYPDRLIVSGWISTKTEWHVDRWMDDDAFMHIISVHTFFIPPNPSIHSSMYVIESIAFFVDVRDVSVLFLSTTVAVGGF